MSTDQQPAPHDPRYDVIYQRSGAEPVQSPDVEPRRAGADELRRTTMPAFAGEQRRVDPPPAAPAPAWAPNPARVPNPAGAPDPAPGSVIREVGAEPEAPEVSARARNPFDVWVWVVAALLTGSGVYLTAAPILFERAMMEAQTTVGSGSMYVNPWWNYTMGVAPTLILLGIGTALVQLFVLSVRHTLRAR